MPLAVGSITALAPAAPGWTVTVTSPSSGDPTTCPVISWASIVVGHDDYGRERTELQPAFVCGREVFTHHELAEIIETVYSINAPAAP
ncbi:hypothetical protein AB0N92_04075 [Streptomyces sp. NPDC093248]|uniref:hypothetical protein n=1 Tax=Streptomyces sp. NPDC093248 TaxID=3155072 RepID=UPI00341BC441